MDINNTWVYAIFHDNVYTNIIIIIIYDYYYYYS